MVDDSLDIGRIYVFGQFVGIVGVDDNYRIVFSEWTQQLGLLKVPVVQHKGRLGVGRAQKAWDGGNVFDRIQVPRP